MKTLQLVINSPFLTSDKNYKRADVHYKNLEDIASPDKALVEPKTKVSWFDKDVPQNLTGKGAAIRGILVVCLPSLSAIDWYLHYHTMILIAPLIMFLAVTALTMNCPHKNIFQQI